MWLPEDTEAALEWGDFQASLCSGCSNPRHESFDAHGPDYDATALRCRACEVRDKRAKNWDGETEGLYFTVAESGED